MLLVTAPGRLAPIATVMRTPECATSQPTDETTGKTTFTVHPTHDLTFLSSDNGPPPSKGGDGDDAQNPGSNLFVTGIHPRLTEDEVARLFEKYGEVEKCNIMRDPHTRESRGFGFVKMVTAAEADAAKEALQGEVYEGRTLSIEKARRARPRTPTPGKYFGPPKRGKIQSIHICDRFRAQLHHPDTWLT